jgi:hypothetical protein
MRDDDGRDDRSRDPFAARESGRGTWCPRRRAARRLDLAGEARRSRAGACRTTQPKDAPISALETLVSYLKEIGIQRFEVDAAEYEAEGGKTGSRPDRAEALRRAHEAAAHDKWFRQQVELGLRDADDPDTAWVGNDDAQSEWAKKRANLAARLAARDKA